MYLYELRNLWQLFFHVTVGAFVTLQIWLRQAQGKAPDYDVWHHPSDILPCLKEEKEGHYHCDEETVHHKWEALLSFSPAVLFKSAWHACEHAIPGRQIPVSRMLAMIIVQKKMKSPLYRAVALEEQSDAIGRLGQQLWIMAGEFSQEVCVVLALRTKQELYNPSLPLWGISTDQIKDASVNWKVYV